MKTTSATILMILAAMLIISSTAPAMAATSTASLQISVTVRPWLKFKAEQSVQMYRVTSEDIRRGYVDVPASASVTVSTNERRPVTITAAANDEQTILIRESGAANFSQSAGVSVPTPGAETVKELDCRIMLAQNTKEGSYPLVVALAPQMP